jgi:hypothetical protein
METPELDRRSEIFARREQPNITLSEFLDWLDSEGISLARWQKFEDYNDEMMFPHAEPREELLARFFDLDINKIRQEQDDLLKEIREQNKK